ncbi:hypothetical protein BDZ97DRAFT_1770256 [Flammula alnicola]|nr:hypothetical protein BDZ97DRAFT_1770256 [Flammula alnicola]
MPWKTKPNSITFRYPSCGQYQRYDLCEDTNETSTWRSPASSLSISRVYACFAARRVVLLLHLHLPFFYRVGREAGLFTEFGERCKTEANPATGLPVTACNDARRWKERAEIESALVCSGDAWEAKRNSAIWSRYPSYAQYNHLHRRPSRQILHRAKRPAIGGLGDALGGEAYSNITL